MENKLEIYTNEEFGNVRTIQEGDKIFFCALDIAKALGYANPRKAVADHCRYVTKRYAPHPQAPNKQIEMTFLPESDVYRLITHSKLPAAQEFERWLFEEVVPSIRKHGAYITKPLLEEILENPEIIVMMADRLAKEHDRAESLSAALLDVAPKAEYYDAFVNPTDATNIRNTAKELQVSEREFCRFLQREGFLYRCPAGNLMPYSKPANEGLFIVRDYYTPTGHYGVYTLITPLGKNLFRTMLCDHE